MIGWLTIFLAMASIAAESQLGVDEIVKVNTQKIVVTAGKDSVVNIEIEVKSGYHIQANKVENEFIVPTTLEIRSDNLIKIKKEVFPVPRKFKLEGTDDYLDVYDEKFEIGVLLNAQKGVGKGLHRLDGKLSYQACDSIRCLFPRSLQFSVVLEVR